MLYAIDAASQAEALHMLHRIRELREQHTTTLQPVMNQIYHTLGMLHYVLEDYTNVSVVLGWSYMLHQSLSQAYEYAQKALLLAQQSPNPPQDLVPELEELVQLSKAHLPTDSQ